MGKLIGFKTWFKIILDNGAPALIGGESLKDSQKNAEMILKALEFYKKKDLEK